MDGLIVVFDAADAVMLAQAFKLEHEPLKMRCARQHAQGWSCTREKGHDGILHVAHTSNGIVRAIWEG